MSPPSPPPNPATPSRSLYGSGPNNDRASSITESSKTSPGVVGRFVRPKIVSRQKTWNGTQMDEMDPGRSNGHHHHGSPAISVAKTINHLLHIPSNRCCADCRSALVDSSQVHASFRPPYLMQQYSASTRRLALTRSDLLQTRDFSRTHRDFCPPGSINSSGDHDRMGNSSRRLDAGSNDGSKQGLEGSSHPSISRSIGRDIGRRHILEGITTVEDSADATTDMDKVPPNGRMKPQQHKEPGKKIVDPAFLARRYVGGHGVFLCTQCAQAHKLMGETVTVVRHVQQFQTWTAEDALAMKEAGGNTMCWKVYEAFIPEHWQRRRPNHASMMTDRLIFCRAKYEAMGFILPPILSDHCMKSWQRLMKYNAWAHVNPGLAIEMRNVVALSLDQANTAVSQYDGNDSNRSLDGLAMPGAPIAELPSRLIDYFCVVGSSGFLDPRILQGEVVDLSVLEGPEDLHLEPRVIDSYPPTSQHTDMEFPEHVATFVLPEGCRPSESQKSPFFFTFVFTSASGHRMYGGCLRLYDEAIETQELREIMEKSDYQGAYPPWLPSQTGPSYGARNSVDSSDYMDIVYLPKCLVVLSHYPFFHLFRNFLVQLYRITLVEAPLPLERFIANFTCEVPLPPEGKVEVKFGFTVNDIWSVQRPPHNQLPLANYSFKPLFACLSVGNILTLVACLLTESRVALCSRHYALLTPIAEALQSFLFPFHWQGVYIPIMPYAMLDILDAPVPFLVGLHARYLIETIPEMRPLGVVFVDLDRDIVHLGYDEDTNSPRMVPALPEKGALKLRAKVEEHGSIVYLPPDNPKLEGNAITNGHGAILPDAKREAYAAAYQPLNDRASGSLPSNDEMRRAERVGPRRRVVLRSVDKAYQENELLTPITGFLSEQGQLYNREPARQLRTQKSGHSGMGKIFNIRRLRSSSNLHDEETSTHFSGHFTQSQENHSSHGIHGVLLDLEEPLGFNSFEIRQAFLRFFVSLLKNYEPFLNVGNLNDPFRLEDFLADLSLSIPASGFLRKALKTQMFHRFLEERQNNPRDPLFLFFDECIIAKHNRSKKFGARTRDTPFLDDSSGTIKETFTPPPPSNWGLPDDGRTYQYGAFPKLDYELFGKIRAPMRWTITHESSSRRMQRSSLISKPDRWQHEILAMAMTPRPGATVGGIYWAAKNGVKNLEAAIGALSQFSASEQSLLSVLPTNNSQHFSSQKGSLENSVKLRGSQKSINALRTGVMDISTRNISLAEVLILNACRIKGVILDEVCKLQSLGRMFLTRRRYRRFLRSLTLLQYKRRRQVARGLVSQQFVLRGWPEVDEADRVRGSISKMQRIVRAFLMSRSYRRKRSSVTLLQRWYRGASGRMRMKKLVRACRRIQVLVLSRRARFGFQLLRMLVAKVQGKWRGYLTRKRIRSRNERRMSRYREQIVLLWKRVHTPLSYRTKFWPIISDQCGFLRQGIAESELERLWIVLEVDFNNGSKQDYSMESDHAEELRLGKLLGITDHTYWRYLKVRDMTSSVLLFPAEERRNPELRLAADRVEAERIQIYERISVDSPRIAAMIVTFYDIFKIDKREKQKKFKLTETVWSEQANASQSEMLMMHVFPELEEASNIIFNPPSKKTLKRFRNVNPTPPRLGKSGWAHSILKDQIRRNVREVAIGALRGAKVARANFVGSNSACEHYMGQLANGTSDGTCISLKTVRRDLIDDFLAGRTWEGEKAVDSVGKNCPPGNLNPVNSPLL